MGMGGENRPFLLHKKIFKNNLHYYFTTTTVVCQCDSRKVTGIIAKLLCLFRDI